jgi:tetratricopeptide (TPR) repeat protein
MTSCIQCKYELAPDFRFCPHCGTPKNRGIVDQYMLARQAMEGRMEGGPLQPAIAILVKAYDMGLRDAHVLCGLGILYFRLGDVGLAIKYLEEAVLRVVELNPLSKIANYHLGVNFASLGQYDKAIIHFKLVVENCPQDEAAFYHLGMAYYESNKISEATEIFKHCVALDPGDRRAAQMLEMLTDVPGV